MYSPASKQPHFMQVKHHRCHCFSSASKDWPLRISSPQPAHSKQEKEKMPNNSQYMCVLNVNVFSLSWVVSIKLHCNFFLWLFLTVTGNNQPLIFLMQLRLSELTTKSSPAVTVPIVASDVFFKWADAWTRIYAQLTLTIHIDWDMTVGSLNSGSIAVLSLSF